MAWPAFAPYQTNPEAPVRPPVLDSSSFPRKPCRSPPYSVTSHYVAPFSEDLSILSNHRESVSSSSGSSVCESASPMGRRPSTIRMDTVALGPDTEAVSSGEPWDLVAYHIPWGPGYEGYDSETGTLPGPDGICVFLRSPTPLKRQRTSQACDKCRERKSKCSGDRPSCARCLSRGILCAYGSSATTDALATSPRAPLRRQSHSGSSVSKPQHLKLSTRSRLGRRSVMDSRITQGGASLQVSSPEFKDTTHLGAFCDDIPTNLIEDPSTYSHISVFGDDFESPVEPLTPSPFVSSPAVNPSYKFSGLSRFFFVPRLGIETGEAMASPRDACSSDDISSTSLYMHPLSALAGYRFPPEDEQTVITTPQPSLATPGFPMHSHVSSIMEPPCDSLLMSNISLSGDLDALWDDTGFFEGSGTLSEQLFPELITSNTPPRTVNDEYNLDNALPSQAILFSQGDLGACELSENCILPDDFPV